MSDQSLTLVNQPQANIEEEYSQNSLVNNLSNRKTIVRKDIRLLDSENVVAVVNMPGEQEDGKKNSEKQQPGRIFNREMVNLDSYQLVWCDTNANLTTNAETVVSLERLRKIVDYTKMFDNVEFLFLFRSKTWT